MNYNEKLKSLFSESEISLIRNMKSDDITFDMLTDGQKDAFIEIVKYINFNEKNIVRGSANIPTIERHISLNGSAGCGKSLLMKFVIDYISIIGVSSDTVMCCAPTHGAKKVLSKFVKRDVSTIHSILNIMPIKGIKNLSFAKQGKAKKGDDDLSEVRYLICDESSFYDKYLFETLMDSIDMKCLIIFVGDKEQLFGTTNKLSPVFGDERFKQLYLTEIKRTDSPIITVASDIREGRIKQVNKTILDSNGNGVIRHYSKQRFMEAYYKAIDMNPENFHENRIVSYYNDNVNSHNFAIRQRVYNTKFQFVVGEYLIAQEPFMILKDGKPEVLFENGTLLKILDMSFHGEAITTPLTPEIFQAKYYKLKVVNEDCPQKPVYNIDVLTDSLVKSYNEFVDRTFTRRIGEVKKHRLNEDDSISYMLLRDARFLSVKHLPSSTIHKAQGTTVDNIFVDASYHNGRMFRNNGNATLIKQLDYVAVTRARKVVHIIY